LAEGNETTHPEKDSHMDIKVALFVAAPKGNQPKSHNKVSGKRK
jgi:hypothetical protein